MGAPREPEWPPSPSQRTRPDPAKVKRAMEERRRIRALPYEEICKRAEANFPGWVSEPDICYDEGQDIEWEEKSFGKG
ncbi:hypothetical protein VTN96DRAFT_2380 [Rasamsonia emersonii]